MSGKKTCQDLLSYVDFKTQRTSFKSSFKLVKVLFFLLHNCKESLLIFLFAQPVIICPFALLPEPRVALCVLEPNRPHSYRGGRGSGCRLPLPVRRKAGGPSGSETGVILLADLTCVTSRWDFISSSIQMCLLRMQPTAAIISCKALSVGRSHPREHTASSP